MTSLVSSISHNQVTPLRRYDSCSCSLLQQYVHYPPYRVLISDGVHLELLDTERFHRFHRCRLRSHPVPSHATLPIYRLRSRLLSLHCALRKYYRHHQCSAEQTNNESNEELGSIVSVAWTGIHAFVRALPSGQFVMASSSIQRSQNEGE